jgi:hypothetical protein
MKSCFPIWSFHFRTVLMSSSPFALVRVLIGGVVDLDLGLSHEGIDPHKESKYGVTCVLQNSHIWSCNVGLFVDTCFRLYHTKLHFWRLWHYTGKMEHVSNNTATCPLKARIVEPEETAVGRKLLGNIHLQQLLEAVFSMRFVPRLCTGDQT